MNPPSREKLHRLVDSLPEGALEAAQRMLTHLQVWPPQRPSMSPELERFREEARKSRGRITAMVGGGAYDPIRGSGSMGSTTWEGDTLVAVTRRYHRGQELNTVERIRLDEDSKVLVYKHSVHGPGNKFDEHEITFQIDSELDE